MKKLFHILPLLLISFVAFGFQYPQEVEKVLKKSGKNRSELQKVLEHYRKDSLKYKAACFLIENMDIHYSQTYYWADSLNNRIGFNELNYKDYTASQAALTELQQSFGKLHTVIVNQPDIEIISSEYLIENIDQAFLFWNPNKICSFDDFCEYILPYRIANEPLQNWRKIYSEKFNWLNDSLRINHQLNPTNNVINYVYANFKDTYKREEKIEPIDRIGALQLLHRMKGACEDIADFEIFILRSLGFVAANDNIPYWATSSSGHSLASVWLSNLKRNITLDNQRVDTVTDKQLRREPAKVIRTTYSKQAGVLADIVDAESIPNNFLRRTNYKDVTAEYWPVKTIICGLEKPLKDNIVYACVLNYQIWQPCWWAKVEKDSATFTNMTTGVVYLPAYYKQGKMIPAGYPVALGKNHKETLKPNMTLLRNIKIEQQEKYLKFRPFKKYTLLYWNNEWKPIETKSTAEDTQELIFSHVPSNALLLLIPEYSARIERPFIITEDGHRVWF